MVLGAVKGAAQLGSESSTALRKLRWCLSHPCHGTESGVRGSWNLSNSLLLLSSRVSEPAQLSQPCVGSMCREMEKVTYVPAQMPVWLGNENQEHWGARTYKRRSPRRAPGVPEGGLPRREGAGHNLLRARLIRWREGSPGGWAW